MHAEEKAFRVMVASPLQPEKPETNGIEIQFWKLTYDPHTRHMHGSLAETFVFSPDELFRPRATRNNS